MDEGLEAYAEAFALDVVEMERADRTDKLLALILLKLIQG